MRKEYFQSVASHSPEEKQNQEKFGKERFLEK